MDPIELERINVVLDHDVELREVFYLSIPLKMADLERLSCYRKSKNK